MLDPDVVYGNAPGDKVPEGDLLIAMTLSEEDMRHVVLRYLAQQGAPMRMVEAAMQAPVEQMFLPVYVFSGRFEAKWSASIAYQRGLNAAEWMPASGEGEGSYAAIVYAGDHLPAELAAAVEQKVDTSLFKTHADLLIKGFEVEEYAASTDSAYRNRGRDNINAAIINELAREAPGDLHDQWACRSHYSLNVADGLVPVGVIQLSYRGKRYDFLIDGAQGGLYAIPPLLPSANPGWNVCMAVLPALCAIAAWVLWMMVVSFPLLPPQPVVFIVCCTIPYWVLRRYALRTYDKKMKSYAAKVDAYQPGNPPPTRGWIVSMIRYDGLVTPLLCLGAMLFVLYPPAMWAEAYAIENGYGLDASGRPTINRPSPVATPAVPVAQAAGEPPLASPHSAKHKSKSKQ